MEALRARIASYFFEEKQYVLEDRLEPLEPLLTQLVGGQGQSPNNYDPCCQRTLLDTGDQQELTQDIYSQRAGLATPAEILISLRFFQKRHSKIRSIIAKSTTRYRRHWSRNNYQGVLGSLRINESYISHRSQVATYNFHQAIVLSFDVRLLIVVLPTNWSKIVKTVALTHHKPRNIQ